MKNTGGQINVPGKTVFLGRLFVDLSGARAFGLPSSAFARRDSQSDCIQALLSCPMFYVSGSPDCTMDMYQVPCSTRGALLWSLSVGLVWAPVMHTDMTSEVRLEAAITGFVLWDLWQLMAARLEAEMDAKAGSMSMSNETVENLQAVSLSVIVLLMTQKDLRAKTNLHDSNIFQPWDVT